jgi:glycine/D-amino acid oxidase-like deaminating enzyme
MPDALRSTVLPQGHVASDTRKLLLYYRANHDGRLIMGGRGPFREPAGPADFGHLETVIALVFPQLKGIRCEYRWSGRVALTRDHLPHVHRPAPGLTLLLGYNGRGVALATALGTLVGANLVQPEAHPLPLPITDPRAIPLHSMHRLYATAILQAYRLFDYLAVR